MEALAGSDTPLGGIEESIAERIESSEDGNKVVYNARTQCYESYCELILFCDGKVSQWKAFVSLVPGRLCVEKILL